MVVDLSVYLVTDSTPAILKGRDLVWVVEEALKGGEIYFQATRVVALSTKLCRCHRRAISRQD